MAHHEWPPLSYAYVRKAFGSLPFYKCLFGLLLFTATPLLHAQCANLGGKWRINDAGIFPGTLILLQSGCSISGQIQFDDGEPVQSLIGSITGSAITFVLFKGGSNCAGLLQKEDATFSGTVSANASTMSGIYDIPTCGQNNWTATRTPAARWMRAEARRTHKVSVASAPASTGNLHGSAVHT